MKGRIQRTRSNTTHKDSICKFTFHDHPLDPHEDHSWLSQVLPDIFWNDIKNQRQFMDWLGKKFGFTRSNDWYKITFKQIRENGGIGLERKYGGDPSKLIQSVYPEHEWHPWRFTHARGYWDTPIHRRRF